MTDEDEQWVAARLSQRCIDTIATDATVATVVITGEENRALK